MSDDSIKHLSSIERAKFNHQKDNSKQQKRQKNDASRQKITRKLNATHNKNTGTTKIFVEDQQDNLLKYIELGEKQNLASNLHIEKGKIFQIKT